MPWNDDLKRQKNTQLELICTVKFTQTINFKRRIEKKSVVKVKAYKRKTNLWIVRVYIKVTIKFEPFVSYRSRASSFPDRIYQYPSKRKINPSFVGKQIRILNTHERPRKMGYFAFVLPLTPLFNDFKPHLKAVIKKSRRKERREFVVFVRYLLLENETLRKIWWNV